MLKIKLSHEEINLITYAIRATLVRDTRALDDLRGAAREGKDPFGRALRRAPLLTKIDGLERLLVKLVG